MNHSLSALCFLLSSHLASAQVAGMKIAGGRVVLTPGTHLTVDSGTLIIQNDARLTMQWESFLHTDGLTLLEGGELNAAGTLNVATMTNSGLVVADSGETLVINGDLSNSGTIRIEEQTALSMNGSFTNEMSGVLDMIFSPSSVPTLRLNEGTVVTFATLPAPEAPDLSGLNPVVRLFAYDGHQYQLEKNPELTDPNGWILLGQPVIPTTPGTVDFEDLTTDSTATTRMFYRVRISD